MKTIDAVIVDTYPQNALARLAIEKTVQTGLVRRVQTFSTAPIYPGEEFHLINPIRTTADYSHHLLNIAPYFSNADATLVIQWDGMPHAKENWNPDFLNYDYIGAPWGNCDESVAVGNGGFSLRSRKLMEALVQLKLRCDPALPDADAEDVVICKHHRQDILGRGCQFAPIVLAQKFSTENSDLNDTFGFHGVFNFPRFLEERELLGCAEELCMRTGRDLFLANFIIGCHNRSYRAFLEEFRLLTERVGKLTGLTETLTRAHIHIPGFF
jgi:hypothetical protein